MVVLFQNYLSLLLIRAEILFSALQSQMIKLILVTILILQTANTQEILTRLNFDPQLNNFEETFKCYLSQKVIKGSLLTALGIWDLYYIWQTVPQEAFEIYKEPAHVFVLTDTRIDHSLYGELAAKALKGQPIKALWVIVTNGCIQSCSELKGFLRDLRNAVGPEATIGICTGPEYWSNTFDEKGCPQIPKEYPLFYTSYFFKDFFYPFGGWKTAEYMISSSADVPGCSVVGEQNSVSYYKKPQQ